MSLIVSIMAGTGVGIGLLLIILGLRGIEETDGASQPSRSIFDRFADFDRVRLRIGLAVGGSLAVGLVTGWPVAVLLTFGGGLAAPTIAGAQKRREHAVALTEAVATWAEQLRDTISSAAGLQEAIAVTAKVAPKEIRAEVNDLALAMRRTPLPILLRQFANAVDDPAADQVAIALILASERRGQNLVGLLTDVAEAAREEATMRMRTETSRAQTYSDARAVTYIVLGMFGVLLVMSRGYLDPFDSLTGQVVLAVVGSLWVGAFYGLAQLSRVRRSPRILKLDVLEVV